MALTMTMWRGCPFRLSDGEIVTVAGPRTVSSEPTVPLLPSPLSARPARILVRSREGVYQEWQRETVRASIAMEFCNRITNICVSWLEPRVALPFDLWLNEILHSRGI